MRKVLTKMTCIHICRLKMVKMSLMEVICQMITVLKEAMVERGILGGTLSMDTATVATAMDLVTDMGDTGIMASTEDTDMAGTDLVATVADMAMATVDMVADMVMATVGMVADMVMATVDMVADMVMATVDMVATESTEAMGMDTEGMAMEDMDTMAKAFITTRAPTP